MLKRQLRSNSSKSGPKALLSTSKTRKSSWANCNRAEELERLCQNSQFSSTKWVFLKSKRLPRPAMRKPSEQLSSPIQRRSHITQNLFPSLKTPCWLKWSETWVTPSTLLMASGKKRRRLSPRSKRQNCSPKSLRWTTKLTESWAWLRTNRVTREGWAATRAWAQLDFERQAWDRW